MTKLERIKVWNENFHKWNAFDQNDFTWIVLGDTYSIKDELKKQGAKFSRELGWHFDHEESGYDLYKIRITEVAEKNFDGKYFFKEDVESYINKIRKANEHFIPTNSNWIGEVGKKILKAFKELIEDVSDTSN